MRRPRPPTPPAGVCQDVPARRARERRRRDARREELRRLELENVVAELVLVALVDEEEEQHEHPRRDAEVRAHREQ